MSGRTNVHKVRIISTAQSSHTKRKEEKNKKFQLFIVANRLHSLSCSSINAPKRNKANEIPFPFICSRYFTLTLCGSYYPIIICNWMRDDFYSLFYFFNLFHFTMFRITTVVGDSLNWITMGSKMASIDRRIELQGIALPTTTTCILCDTKWKGNWGIKLVSFLYFSFYFH